MVRTTKTEENVEIEYLYRRYQVNIEMLSGIAGGIPMTKGLATNHIARFSNRVTNDLKLSMKSTGEVSEEAAEKYMMSCSSGFNLDADGIYIRGHQINAMLKDAAQNMKATLKIRGLGRTIRAAICCTWRRVGRWHPAATLRMMCQMRPPLLPEEGRPGIWEATMPAWPSGQP